MKRKRTTNTCVAAEDGGGSGMAFMVSSVILIPYISIMLSINFFLPLYFTSVCAKKSSKQNPGYRSTEKHTILAEKSALLIVHIRDNALNAKIAKAALFVNMGDDALIAKSAEVALFVNMGDDALDAKSAEAALFVNRVVDRLQISINTTSVL